MASTSSAQLSLHAALNACAKVSRSGAAPLTRTQFSCRRFSTPEATPAAFLGWIRSDVSCKEDRAAVRGCLRASRASHATRTSAELVPRPAISATKQGVVCEKSWRTDYRSMSITQCIRTHNMFHLGIPCSSLHAAVVGLGRAGQRSTTPMLSQQWKERRQGSL